MSAATSPGTGLAYGLQRVCAAWGFARSSFYAMKSRRICRTTSPTRCKFWGIQPSYAFIDGREVSMARSSRTA